LRVGAVRTPAGLAHVANPPACCDVVALHIDSLLSAGLDERDLEPIIKDAAAPLLLTFATPADDRRRIDVLSRLSRSGTAIDCEFSLLPANQAGAPQPVARGAVLVLSAHSFDSELSADEIEARLAAMRRIPAKIYRLACACNTPAALDVMEHVQRRHPNDTALMGLGQLAAECRKRLPAAGSRLLYGFLDEPSADDQPHASELPAPPER
jgi:3-dehydroquinate dehydratase-1